MRLEPVAGSRRQPVIDVVSRLGRTDRLVSELASVSVVFRRGTPVTRMEEAARYFADCGLTVSAGDLRLRVTGPVGGLEAALHARTERVLLPTRKITHRVRQGALYLPDTFHDQTLAVLGLDDRPCAQPHFHLAPRDAGLHSFTLLQIAQIYGLPVAEGKYGEGRKIGILELDGGYRQSDMEVYFRGLGIEVPEMVNVSVLGASNDPAGDPASADGEVALDIQVAGAIAPRAQLRIYFAPNTEQGFLEGILQAAQDGVDALSISWGAPEDRWTAQAAQAIDQALQACQEKGIVVTAAAGDSGSSDGEVHPVVDFPAASPHALACGGTTLTATATRREREIVWGTGTNTRIMGGTGGGFSRLFPIPAYQSAQALQAAGGGGTYRGVPDVAACADPATGYAILVDGHRQTIGGTSAVAPLWAAALVLLRNAADKPVSLSALYASAPEGFYPVDAGSNGCYHAMSGWDACCGLGTPHGQVLLQKLRGDPVTPDCLGDSCGSPKGA